MAGTPRAERPTLTLKLCLAGESGVGKTSLMHRFVSNTFDDRYLATLGAKVSSRKFTLDDPARPGQTLEVVASVWDIMGHPGFREIFRDAYFLNAQGVLLVCDATRPETLRALPAWDSAVRAVVRAVPTVVLVNKSDLRDQVRLRQEEMDALCRGRGWRWFLTSAKTGQNVEEAFEALASQYLEGVQPRRANVAPAA